MMTQKQETFCLKFIESGDASDAYRKSFDCSKMKPKTVWEASSKLMATDKVITRIAGLRKNASDKSELTLIGHLNDLKVLRDAALKSKQYGAAVNAEIHRGKASGLYTTKINANISRPLSADGEGLTDDELMLIAKGSQ